MLISRHSDANYCLRLSAAWIDVLALEIPTPTKLGPAFSVPSWSISLQNTNQPFHASGLVFVKVKH